MELLARFQRESVVRIRVRPAIESANDVGDEGHSEQAKEWFPLQTYLKCLFLHPEINSKYKIANVTYKVCFWSVYAFSMSNEVLYFKEFLLLGVQVGDVRSFIDLALIVITISTKICHLSTVVLNSTNQVPDGGLQLTEEDMSGKNPKRFVKKRFVSVVVAITFIQAFAQTLALGFGFHNWYFRDLILTRSYELQTGLLIWTRAGMQNGTMLNSILEVNQQLSTSNLVPGSVGLLTDFATFLHTTAIRNLLFVVSFAFCLKLLRWKIPLNDDGIKEVGKSARGPGEETEKEKKWSEYFSFRMQSRKIGGAFGSLMLLTQAQNIISCAHFLQEFFHEPGKLIFFYLVLSWNIMVLAGFICSLALAWKDGKFREWVVENYCEDDYIMIEGREIRFQAAMEDLQNHPVGIRNAGIYINFAFVATFIGILTSYFVFISPSSAINKGSD